MQLYYLFFHKYLLSKRAGSVIRVIARLCWVATLIGVFSLVCVQSIMNGFNQSIQSKLLGVDAHLSVMGFTENPTSEILQSIQDELSVKEISVFSKQDVILRTLDGEFSGAEAVGYDQKGLSEFLNRLYKVKEKKVGTSIVYDTELDDKEVLIGVSLARNLNVFEGDEILIIPPETLLMPSGEALRFERFRIKGFLNTDTDEHDSRMLVFKNQNRLLQFQTKSSTTMGIDIVLKDVSDAEKAKEKLEKIMPQFQVQTWKDKNSAMVFALRLEKAAMQGVLGLAILITSFSLITVVTMLMAQKKREIGLLQSLGLSDKKLRKLFLNIGLWLSGLGLFLGLVMGLLVSVYIEKNPIEIMPDIYYDSALPAKVDYFSIAQIGIFICIIAFLAAYLPIRSYTAHTPSENLRK